MSSLFYLSGRTIKNTFLEILRKPSQLILYLIMLLGSLSFLVTSLLADPAAAPGLTHKLDIGWLKLIYLGYLLLFGFTSLQSSMSKNTTLFSMPDVNLLFVSPVSPKQILVYALSKQALRSLLASVFILFITNTLTSTWNIRFVDCLMLFFGYAFSIVFFQFGAVLLHLYSSKHRHLRNTATVILIALLVPFAVSLLVKIFQGIDTSQAFLLAIQSPVVLLIPVAGWVTTGIFAVFSGQLVLASVSFAVTSLMLLLCVVLFRSAQADYYEDAIVGAETALLQKQAALEGGATTSNTKTKKIRSTNKKSQQIQGVGASAFLGKHLLENKRSNRLIVFNGLSLTYIIAGLSIAFFSKSNPSAFVLVVAINMMMRIFLIGAGRGMLELSKHYIFMVPASSFSKIVWSNLEIIVSILAESALVFGIAGIILGENPLVVVMAVAASCLFGMLLISADLLSMRIFSNLPSVVLLILYLLLVLLVMSPGIILAMVVHFMLDSRLNMAASFGVLSAWEFLVAGLFFFFSRGVLDSCDIQTMQKTTK